ncbi:hypothetical protein CCACVL1_29782 [Corchorus capsularis]|uniref:Uncharacterized protein n=1 Tax=Corchorus capsularis TaxID=210143 RepID=A0A1R3G040_COCAP|nr:hypothetical protein CCACVL1_29782 [Corchorus capsularis]
MEMPHKRRLGDQDNQMEDNALIDYGQQDDHGSF